MDDFRIKAALILFLLVNFVLFRQPGLVGGSVGRCWNLTRLGQSSKKNHRCINALAFPEFRQCPEDLDGSREAL